MLGKRFRRTTSMTQLGPGMAAAAAGLTPQEVPQVITSPYSAPPKAPRPSVLQVQGEIERADQYGDVSMVAATSAGTEAPACCANDNKDANMEVATSAWEADTGSVVGYGDAGMQIFGAHHSGGAEFTDVTRVTQSMQTAHAGFDLCFHEQSPGVLMSYQMGLWITQKSGHAGYGRGAKLEEPYLCPVNFLEVCFYCKRRLKHERDIFIYRGDTAFCSEECRHRQIMIDERRATRGNGNSSKRGGARADPSSSETAVAA